MITKDALSKYAKTLDRRFVDRHKTVGASEIGACAGRVWYVKHDINHDENFVRETGAATRGTVFENSFWVPALRKHYGEKLLYAGGDQKTMTLGNLSATPDGLLIKQPHNALAGLMVKDIGSSGCIVVECKSLDSRVHLSAARPENIFQAQTQMGLFRLLTDHKPDYAVISYTNANDFDDVREFVVKFDPKIFAQAQRRADLILAATSADELEPEGYLEGGRECNYCAFKKSCDALRNAVPEGEDPVTDQQVIAEFADLARAERRTHAIAGVAETEHRKMQEAIKHRLRDYGLRRVEGLDYSITFTTVKGRTSYDMKAISEACEAAGIDLNGFMKEGNAGSRLNVDAVLPPTDVK